MAPPIMSGRWFAAVTLLVSLVLGSGAWAQVVYVNNNIPSPNNSVSALSVGPGGTLTPLAGSPYLTGGGGSFSPNVGAVDIVTSGGYLYATNALTNTVAAFAINEDGTLATVPGSPFPTLGTRPNGIAINAAGTRLFAADNVSNNVAVFDIFSNGALSLVLGAPFAVAAAPLDLDIDSTNSRLFVSHDTLGVGVYAIAGDGSLSAIGGSPFAAGSGLRGMAVDTASARLYAANGLSNTVSGFTIGGGGALTAVSGSPFAAGTGPTAVAFHPALSVLYVSNDTSNDINAFTIGGGGALTPLAGSPFATGGQGTAGIVIDAVRSRLLAVNGGTNPTPSRDVSVFDIDGTGALTPVAGSPFSTGVASGRPSSIAFATVTRPDCMDTAPGTCIPGRGKPTTECVAEWLVDTEPPPSLNPRTNLPDDRVFCQDGNTGCDFDSTVGTCTFRVRICINNTDPRLSCTPSDVAGIEVFRPRWNSGDVTDVANLNEITRAMSGGSCSNDPFRSCLVNGDCLLGGVCTGAAVIGVPLERRGQTIQPGTTNTTDDLCSNPMSIQVPLRATGGGFRPRSKSFRHRLRTSAGGRDADVLRLTCFPSP